MNHSTGHGSSHFHGLQIRAFPSLLALAAALIFQVEDAAGSAVHTAKESAKVAYTESGEVIINPERGMYDQVACNSTISASTYASLRNQGISLTLCYVNLGEYTTSPIGQSLLNVLQQQMDNMRTAGVKTILRFTYNQSDSGVDAAPKQVMAHMEQLDPLLEKNKDVIAAIESGFIGSWGEASNSISFGQSWKLTEQNWADRKAVALKQLETTPVERMVLLRTPIMKMTFSGSTPLSASEAFNGSARARQGHHNDCFLASSSDIGTYTNTATEYPYLQADTTYTAMGGETCRVNAPRTDCPTALKEMSMFHWSFLHLHFKKEVLDGWRAQGCFTEVEKKLGYRFVLQNGAYSPSAKPGGGFQVNFSVKNQGWAAPFNARDVELVLRNSSSGELYRFKLNADPRFWLADKTITVKQTVTLPSNMAKGNYTVLLNLPDPMPVLRNRPAYSIQLANKNMWEASTGFNNLNHTVSVAPENK